MAGLPDRSEPAYFTTSIVATEPFFFRSVLYNIKEKEKEDQQKVATDRLIKALWASIVEKIIDDEETKQMTQIDPNKNSYIFLQQKTQSE